MSGVNIAHYFFFYELLFTLGASALFYILQGVPHGCAKKVEVADFGLFFGTPLGIPIVFAWSFAVVKF